MSLAEWLKESKRMRVNVRSMERSNILDELSGEQRDISRSREETFDNAKKKLAYFKANLADIKDIIVHERPLTRCLHAPWG